MRDAHPLIGDLLIALYARTKVTLNNVVVVLVDGCRGERYALFAHSVHISLKLRKHGLTVKGSLVGLHELVENVKLFIVALAFCQLTVRHKELVNGGCNLGYKNGVARVVGLVVVVGEPRVHRVSCLVSEGGNVIKLVGKVEQDVGLGAGCAGGECAASLAAAGEYVYPSLFAQTCAQIGLVLFAKHLNGLKDFLYCLLIGVFGIDITHQGGVDIIQVEIGKTENLFFEIVVIIQNRQACIYGIDKVVVNNGGDLIVEGGGGDGIGKVADLGARGGFLYSCLVKVCKGVCKLLVGLIGAIKCRLAHTAVLAHQVCYVVGIGDLYLFAILTANFAKAQVGVGKDAANARVRAKCILHTGHQNFALVGKGVLLFEHDLIDHTAEGLKLGALLKPFVDHLAVKLENVGRNEPRCFACGDGKHSCPCAECLRVVIGGVNRKAQGCILIQFINDIFHSDHIGKSGIELLCTLRHGLGVCAECLDLFFGKCIVGIESRFVGINNREIPFVFGVNVFSFVYHSNSSKNQISTDFILL